MPAGNGVAGNDVLIAGGKIQALDGFVRVQVSAELNTKEVEGIAGTPVVVNDLVAQNGVAERRAHSLDAGTVIVPHNVAVNGVVGGVIQRDAGQLGGGGTIRHAALIQNKVSFQILITHAVAAAVLADLTSGNVVAEGAVIQAHALFFVLVDRVLYIIVQVAAFRINAGGMVLRNHVAAHNQLMGRL